MNNFLSWCRHLLVPFLFHAVANDLFCSFFTVRFITHAHAHTDNAPDGLTTKHLRYGGPAVVHWLTEI